MADKLCDSYCKNCVFSQNASGDWLKLCTYFLTTGIRRPCPAGDGCTVKETGKKKPHWRKEADKKWKNIKKQKTKKREKKPKPDKTVTVICRICGVPFQTTDTRRRFCSDVCRDVARKQQYKEYDLYRRKRHGENQAN